MAHRRITPVSAPRSHHAVSLSLSSSLLVRTPRMDLRPALIQYDLQVHLRDPTSRQPRSKVPGRQGTWGDTIEPSYHQQPWMMTTSLCSSLQRIRDVLLFVRALRIALLRMGCEPEARSFEEPGFSKATCVLGIHSLRVSLGSPEVGAQREYPGCIFWLWGKE